MAKHYLNVLLSFFWICVTVAYGQTIVYGALNSNVTLICPYSAAGGLTLSWIGPPYTEERGIMYINSVNGVNPNTVLGTRLSVVGDNTAGEYSMMISNLQQTDEGRYSCEYGKDRTLFTLQIKVLLSTVTIDPQSITVTEGGTSQATCTTSDSVPAANITWYKHRQGSTPVKITNGISNTQQNKKTISTLTYTGQKQDNNGNIYCNASQDSIEIKSQNVPISVIYKPSNIHISPSFDPYIVYVSQTGVELQCSADVGNPPSISYTWSHNGVITNNNPYVIIEGKNSGGNYTCTASNTAGTIITSKVLIVQHGPEIQPFSKQQPVEGSRFVLSCSVSGIPAPTSQQIWWTRRNDNTFIQQGNQLVIDNIQKGYSDTYTCHAQNTLTPSGQSSINKTASIDVEVDVLYRPVLTTSPNYSPLILYVRQQNVQLTCSSTQANPSSVTYWWTYNNQNYNNPVYTLSPITKTSGGNYTCNGRNTVGSSSSMTPILIQYGAEIHPFSKQQPVEGSRFVLSCSVSGSPAPTSQQIWWTRRNDNTFRQHGNQLVIDNIQKGHSDTYTCHAQNTLTPSGQSSINKASSQNVEVDVLYKPVLSISPYYNPLILYVGQQNVQLTCSSSQANPSIVTYWWTYNNQNYNNPIYTLSPVTKTSDGNYTCNGRNTVGTSSSTMSVAIQYGPSINQINPQKFISGRNASVTCNVNSYPMADVTWTGPNSLQQTGSTINFSTVLKSQKGIYKCTATNTLTPSGETELQKQQQMNVSIDILYKPEVMAILSQSIVEGGILNIKCLAQANPPAHIYKWTKIGDNNFQQLNETLVITNIKRTQSGKYRCTAMNTMSPTNGQLETGEGHGEVTIKVKYPPEIKDLDIVGSGMERSEGEIISFKCVIDSYPNSDVTWISKTGNNRHIYIDYKKQISYFNITLTCLDTGLYQCSASNKIGIAAINETRLFVKCSPRLDNRIPQNDINRVALDAGDKINISVQYLAYPSATVIWSKFNYTSLTNEIINPSNHGYKIENQYFTFSQKSMLTKANITQKDFGTIIVTFDNGISASSSRFIVETKGKPDKPTDLSVICVSENTINVSWTSHFNGGHTQYFRVQLKASSDLSFRNWTNVIPDLQKKTNIYLTDLLPNTPYTIRVVAINLKGESVSMEQTSCITRMSLTTNDSSASVILGSILAVVVVLAVFIIVVISCRKRGQKCTQNSKKGPESKTGYRASSEESQLNNADNNVYEGIVSDNEQANIQNSYSNTYETLTANGISTNHNVYSTLTGTDANDIQLEHVYLNTTLKTGKTNK